jgi:hypothetical protein
VNGILDALDTLFYSGSGIEVSGPNGSFDIGVGRSQDERVEERSGLLDGFSEVGVVNFLCESVDVRFNRRVMRMKNRVNSSRKKFFQLTEETTALKISDSPGKTISGNSRKKLTPQSSPKPFPPAPTRFPKSLQISESHSLA